MTRGGGNEPNRGAVRVGKLGPDPGPPELSARV